MIGNVLAGLLGGTAQRKQKFEKTLTLDDMTSTNTSVKQGTWVKIFEYQIGAQQMGTWGAGSIVNGVDNRKIAYIKLQNSTPAEIKGWIRLIIADANEVRKIVVFEERTERLSASKTDKTQAYLLGEYPIKAKEDSKLIIEFKADSDDTISLDNSEAMLPVTIYV